MSRLLYIQASPRVEATSSAVAETFLAAYRDAHPGDVVDTLDLWDAQLPAFDGEALRAKYRLLHGGEHRPAEAQAWEAVVQVAERFKAADRYLFSVPMWNFSIPYVLKHYIDVVTQPGLTFSFSPAHGYRGLLTGRSAVLVYARGGTYAGPEGEALDFQKRYMDLMLGFLGIQDTHSILVEPTLGDEATVAGARSAAMEQARACARSWA